MLNNLDYSLRCEVTGNICGTGAWMTGGGCKCGQCEKYLQRVRLCLGAARQYQQDFQLYGVNRVYRYFDGVDGNWLDEW